ncbi:MAG: TadE/TadG family type IV pilus assembly protein [Vicinamibacterales bacterium]
MKMKPVARERERGSAMVEAAISIPLLLVLMVGIFEVGRAYETWQVLTNAAREGARMSITPSSTNGTTTALIRQYMADGQLNRFAAASVVVDKGASINVNGTPVSASLVTVDYPFEFIMLQPVVRLVAPGATVGGPITMRATAVMRNEAP